MENQIESKWYNKPNGIILLLFLFFPLGIYLMWKNGVWSFNRRAMITVGLILLIIVSINSPQTKETSNTKTDEHVLWNKCAKCGEHFELGTGFAMLGGKGSDKMGVVSYCSMKCQNAASK